jgi:hypothetical protein
MVDTDASLQVLMKWRFLVCDRRYYWNCGFIYGNNGGCQDIRTASVRARDRSIMRQKWGDAFDIDRKSRTGTSVNAITVDRRLKI